MTTTADSLRATVRDKYAAVARGEVLSCCGDAGCADDINMIGDAYNGIDGYVAEADLQLGCGLPVEHARLEPGQTVLDLGSGAGLDAFVARRVVGENGRVLGVDFTPEMIDKARQNAVRLGYTNVSFEHGEIEALPFHDGSVDVVISNCVLNLVPDKERAFAEMARVLRPGGHFCVSDVVSRGTLPTSVRQSAELYAGCVAGALDQADYVRLLTEAGFDNVEVAAERPIALPEGLLSDGAPLPLYSVTVRGVRPDPTISTTNPDTDSDPMPSLQIYEPAMCCSTGLCGPDPDEALIQFAADIKALSAEGVSVQRFNLSQTPDVFVNERIVNEAMGREGMGALPIVVREGEIVSTGRYPSRGELTGMAGPGEAPTPETSEGGASIYTQQVAELVAIGAAIASNCEPCFRFHYDQARKLGVSREDKIRAVNTAQAVKDAPARAMMDLAAKYLDPEPAPAAGGSCCGGNDTSCC